MEVIILSSEDNEWSDNLFEFINLDFDTQFMKSSQFENFTEDIDKPVVIVCNVDAYLDLQNIFVVVNPMIVLVVIDNVYFDPYDTRFKVNPNINLSLSVYGNINKIINPEIFGTATFHDANCDSEGFLQDIKKEIKIINDMFVEHKEPLPEVKNRVEVVTERSRLPSNRYRMSGVKVRGIFSNNRSKLSLIQNLKSK